MGLFDILSFVAIFVGGYLGYLIGALIGLYLLVLGAAVIILVKSIFVMEKMKAYIVLFISMMVISIVSVSFFGIIFGETFKRPIIKRINRILGALVGVVFMLVLFKNVVSPVAQQVSPDGMYQEMKASYVMNSMVPAVEGLFPGFQETLQNGVNSFLTSLSPKPPEEEKTPDDKDKDKDKKDDTKQGKDKKQDTSSRVKQVRSMNERPWDHPDDR